MNYCAEMNSFYNWVMLNPLPADAQALWCALMNINNRCAVYEGGKWYWRVEFTVPNSTLTSMLKFSRTQLDRMRNILIQAGRIVYKKGRGSQSGKYSFVPFDAQYVTQFVTQTRTLNGHKCGTDSVEVWVLCANMCTLNNNNNKYNIFGGGGGARAGEDAGEAMGLFEAQKDDVCTISEKLFTKFFGRRPTPQDNVWVWMKVRTMDDSGALRVSNDKVEMLEYAFEEALRANAPSIKYIDGIYGNFFRRGIKSPSDIADFDFLRDRENGKI